MRKTLTTLLLALCAVSVVATTITPSVNLTTYYTASTLDGKNGRQLELALKAIVYPHTKISYENLWSKFPTTDPGPADSIPSTYTGNKTDLVYDMYAWMKQFTKFYSDNNHTQTGGINREHVVPNAWWGAEEGNAIAYTDLHHLTPADGYANNAKSNYPLGEFASGMTLQFPKETKSTNSGYTYVTADTHSHTVGGVCYASASHVWKVSNSSNYGGASYVFEPADEYKGDFARMYLYVVCAYEGELTWQTTYMFTSDANNYTTIKQWAKELLLKWHRQDPVSDKERNRNNAVYSLQNNRNPFIDYPELVEYIWGNMSTQSFSLANATSSYSSSYSGDPVTPTTHTVSWSVNGTITSTADYAEGAAITFPTDVTVPAGSGKVFRGWTATAINGTTDTEPTLVSSATMGTADVTYYAVFADQTGGLDNVTHVMEVPDMSGQTNGYVARTATDDQGATWGGVHNYYQYNNIYYWSLNASDNYYIASPRFSRNVVSVVITARNSASTSRTLLLSGSNTAHPTSSDLGSSNTIAAYTTEDITMPITQDFNQFYIYVASNGIGIRKITVVEGTPITYAEYCTTIPTSTQISVSAVGYSTYYNSRRAYTMPSGMEGYAAYVSNGFHFVKTYEAGDVVPAGTALVLKANQGSYTLAFTTENGSTPQYNDLLGTDERKALEEDPNAYFYALTLNAQKEPSSVGFYWMNDTGSAFTNGAHKAYLKRTKSSNAPSHYTFENQADEATYIEAVEAGNTAVKFIQDGHLYILKDGIVYTITGQVVR